jgi:hypothetical protein
MRSRARDRRGISKSPNPQDRQATGLGKRKGAGAVCPFSWVTIRARPLGRPRSRARKHQTPALIRLSGISREVTQFRAELGRPRAQAAPVSALRERVVPTHLHERGTPVCCSQQASQVRAQFRLHQLTISDDGGLLLAPCPASQTKTTAHEGVTTKTMPSSMHRSQTRAATAPSRHRRSGFAALSVIRPNWTMLQARRNQLRRICR